MMAYAFYLKRTAIAVAVIALVALGIVLWVGVVTGQVNPLKALAKSVIVFGGLVYLHQWWPRREG